ncbi:retinoid-inducible serine carboxypeptidase-like isoform X2 [Paramacrobiotus metropolitanus]|uniref:retinoid-inducible serine carboxypeptidase-like isoform X2 n=1 Tax=Paramacrobiotus metropolitanus TaxID=2943436 RepID=UPI0024462C8C|nr:retinoid-inducible serine carboxypeptidase-like isoform X2 [Paramacrobiotus metropolitanus]
MRSILGLAFIICAIAEACRHGQQYMTSDDDEHNRRHMHTKDGQEEWGYVTVRENAHMFWWLYNYPAGAAHMKKPRPGTSSGSLNNDERNTAASTTPLVLWLQGGPGGSGTGFGNFAEIGPLDISLKMRSTTWLKSASLLFVDNPVGTGYSYVTDPGAYAKTVDQIAEDLVTLFIQLYQQKPELENAPLFIFSESYGGKMAAVFAVHLWKAVQKGLINAKFRGVAMGDSWVHPEMIVHSWGLYLYSTSLIDKPGLQIVNQAANNISRAIQDENWTAATELWDAAEGIVGSVTDGVDWYNILNPLNSHSSRLRQSRKLLHQSRLISNHAIKNLYERRMAVHQNDALDDLMNGPIRQKLKIIPGNVTWGGQSSEVFANQAEEFMKPVVNSVDYLLNNTALKVVVYNGQLDLICDSIGVEAWVSQLHWPGLPDFITARRIPLTLDTSDYVVGFSKQYKTFSFYWMLRGGHMLPADQGQASLRMLNSILFSK